MLPMFVCLQTKKKLINIAIVNHFAYKSQSTNKEENGYTVRVYNHNIFLAHTSLQAR